MDVLARIRVIDGGITLERRECARQTFARRLMAGRAIGAEELHDPCRRRSHPLLAEPQQQAHLPLYLLAAGGDFSAVAGAAGGWAMTAAASLAGNGGCFNDCR